MADSENQVEEKGSEGEDKEFTVEKPAGKGMDQVPDQDADLPESVGRETPAGLGEWEKTAESGKSQSSRSRKTGNSKESSHRGAKKGKTKELVNLLEKKNEALLELGKKLENSEQSIKNKEDKILRLAAEFENFKKRTRREWDLHRKRANAELLLDILGVLDDFDRAFEASTTTGDHFESGIRLIHSTLLDVLKRAELMEMEVLGKPFDPQFHEAVGETESNEVEAGCVAHVVQKGYLHHGQLLRPARVIVNKIKAEGES
ncbi:MAG: nucleotide exchange factor GrpE [Candidatus Krumholzibacteriota bacterium]|nr:nucleotide exchange factor GrpE [Candidatus Krumholzibacteriota bacterium]